MHDSNDSRVLYVVGKDGTTFSVERSRDETLDVRALDPHNGPEPAVSGVFVFDGGTFRPAKPAEFVHTLRRNPRSDSVSNLTWERDK